MPLPTDYSERVYAGVLGKLIGVYLGRPFEGWTYERIVRELGEITGYVNERMNRPLIVTDDDISGTFTFLRALPDYGNPRDLTPAQIGQTWLNYLIERQTTLWWGGMGNSTEHTAYMRLKNGIAAPDSGSIATNGPIVAEQIGAQIFIDGWAMVAPGDPALAADLAKRAGSVSHDGESVYAAQVLAAMEAQAFVESDIDALIDTGLRFIPADSRIRRLIDDIRTWHAAEPDWHATRERIAAHYGYDKYPGVCHVVPNHGLIVFSLLYGGGDFARTMTIVNTSGWDTDCNAGNIGCLLGIRNGLSTFEGSENWRGPIADRLLISSADGGRSVSDAATETLHIVNIGRALNGEPPLAPKGGARFHFELPGSVQGFSASDGLSLENVALWSDDGHRALALRYSGSGAPATATTPTFPPDDSAALPPYDLVVCPTLYPGQAIEAALKSDKANAYPVTCRLVASVIGPGDTLTTQTSTPVTVAPGATAVLRWSIPNTDGAPICTIGVEVSAPGSATLYLDKLTWSGAPDVTFTRPAGGGFRWRRAWVQAVEHFDPHWPEPFRLAHNHGRGLLIQGAREWTDYEVSSRLTPHMARANGIAARVQGMERYYALLLCAGGLLRLVKVLDGETVLAERPFDWQEETPCTLQLRVSGQTLSAFVDGVPMFEVEDAERPLTGGAIALVCEEGCLSSHAVVVTPTQ
jgi:ADP-ribosylglycohydrolase